MFLHTINYYPKPEAYNPFLFIGGEKQIVFHMKLRYHNAINNREQGKSMKKTSYLLLTFFLFAVTSSSVTAVSTDFLKRGLKHCTGHCDGNIICWKGLDKQGYYDWCKKNCLHDTKTNLQDFKDAISKCDAKNADRWKSYSKGTCLPEADLRKLIWDIYQNVNTEDVEAVVKNNLPEGLALESFKTASKLVSSTEGKWYDIYMAASKDKKSFETEQEGKVCTYTLKEAIKTHILKLRIK